MIRRAQLTSRQGVFVSGVQVGGVAANGGLRTRDIVMTVDDVRVDDLAGFRTIYDNTLESETELVLLLVKRGALTRFVLLKQAIDQEGDE